jgi:hypothetical protein
MSDRWDEKAIGIADDVLADGIAKLGAKHIAAALREAFEAGVVEEREACAKVVDARADYLPGDIAAFIRARGSK